MSNQTPTEKQLKYARDLGISVPGGATKADVSEMIEVRKKGDRPASSEIRGYADALGIKYGPYAGERALLDDLIEKSGGERLGAWFSFCVYRDLVRPGKPTLTNPADEIFLEAGRYLMTQPGVFESIRRYSGDGLVRFGEWTSPDGVINEGGSRRTKAYKAAAEYLSERLSIKRHTKQAHTAAQRAQKPSPSGCFTIIALITVASAGLIWVTGTAV